MSEIKETTLPRIITTRTLQKESNKSVLSAMAFFKEVLDDKKAELKHRLTAAKAIVDTNLKISSQLIKEDAHELNKRLTTVKIATLNQTLTPTEYKHSPTNVVSTDVDPQWEQATTIQ